MTLPGYQEVLLSLVLVALAFGISRWWRLPVSKEIVTGSVRSFVQLVAVGYALELIFDLKSIWVILLAIAVMIVVGAQAACHRVTQLKRPFGIVLAAMSVGSLATLGSMLAVGVISMKARYVIPLAGMIISNAMNAAAISMERVCSDICSRRDMIETSLSLGKTWREAVSGLISNAIVAGMIFILNFMKTVGIVALPGAMTGMILAGASPLEAVLLQVIVAYMLVSAVTLTAVMAVELTVRRFFTSAHQLRPE